jgi:hypothetical protein
MMESSVRSAICGGRGPTRLFCWTFSHTTLSFAHHTPYHRHSVPGSAKSVSSPLRQFVRFVQPAPFVLS